MHKTPYISYFLVTKLYLTLHFLYKAKTTLKTIYPKMIILEDIFKKNSIDSRNDCTEKYIYKRSALISD